MTFMTGLLAVVGVLILVAAFAGPLTRLMGATGEVVDPAALTILASVQWFELAEQMMSSMGFGPIAAVPRMRCAPAAVADVAVAVADVVTALVTRGVVIDGRKARIP